MIEEDKDELHVEPHPYRDGSFLSHHEVFLSVMRKTFDEMDRKKLESCPPGCLVIFWPGERTEA